MSIHIKTPLLESRAYSIRAGKKVMFKMEALQPTGSFKIRGIGNACSVHKRNGATRFISSSGGNAGYAVAFAGRMLEIPVVVVVPKTTSERAKALISVENAEVIVHGDSWMEANAKALDLMAPSDAFIHPFDDSLLWEGHATMIDELVAQAEKPDLVVCSVGGGGLLCGVVTGLQRNAWGDVPVLAAETQGADSFAHAMRADKPVLLAEISSIATSLGARMVCGRAVELARMHPVESVVVSDADAVDACAQLLDDQRILVEPACGASLAALRSASHHLAGAHSIVVILCGGVGVTAQQLERWKLDLAGRACKAV